MTEVNEVGSRIAEVGKRELKTDRGTLEGAKIVRWPKVADKRQNSAMGLLKTWIYAKLFLFGFSHVLRLINMRIGFEIRL